MPAWNEEAMVERVVREHLRALEQWSAELAGGEIVCLNDGSRDATGEILDRLATSERRVRVVHHPQNMGIHASLVDLYAAATGTHVYVTASDGQWPVKNLDRLMREVLETGADFVVGVRGNRREIYGIRRLLVSHLFNLIPQMLFGVATGDAGSNKLARKELLDTKIVSTSPFAEAERIVKAGLEGATIRSVEIDFQSRSTGKTTGASVRNIVASMRDVFACLRKYGFRPTRHTPDRP